MTMQRFKRAVVAGGQYVDRNTGREKTRWHEVGVLFKDPDDGSLSLKLHAMPIGKDFDGWINLFDFETPEERTARLARQAGQAQAPANGAPKNAAEQMDRMQARKEAGAGTQESFDDDIPF